MHHENEFANRIQEKTNNDVNEMNAGKDDAVSNIEQESNESNARLEENVEKHVKLEDQIDNFLHEGLRKVVPTGE